VNPYEILGVSKDADGATIKRARQKKAKALHPDRNKDPRAVQAMSEVNAAYDMLMDADRRAHYDRTGEFTGARVTTDEEEARKLIFQMFLEALQAPGRVNVPRYAERKMKGMMVELVRQRGQFEKQRDKLQRMLPEVETDDPVNLYEQLVANQIAMLTQKLDSMVVDARRLELAIEIVRRYRSGVVEQAGPVTLDIAQMFAEQLRRARGLDP
jgi:curved DNA-binding protein CbpA